MLLGTFKMVFNNIFLVHTKSSALLHGVQAVGDGAGSAREEQASFNSEGAFNNTSYDSEASFPLKLQQSGSKSVKASLLYFDILLANKNIYPNT